MREFHYEFAGSEKVKLDKFHKYHRHPNQPFPTSGGRFVYSFNPSGIGTSIKLKCLTCSKEKDITAYDDW